MGLHVESGSASETQQRASHRAEALGLMVDLAGDLYARGAADLERPLHMMLP
jgi:hypothetical protein